jgi:hypothetical protein
VPAVQQVELAPPDPSSGPHREGTVRTPSRGERAACALVGLVAGTAIGALLVATEYPSDALAGVFTGVGAAIAGAITGKRWRLVTAAAGTALVTWLVVASQVPGREAVPVATAFGAPAALVVGAALAVLLRHRIRWLDPHAN